MSLHRCIRILPGLLVAFHVCNAFAQDTPVTTETGTLHIRFLSSKTGAAVIPERLAISGRPLSEVADQSGLAAITLPNGPYEIEVTAKGFSPIKASIVVEGDSTSVNEFELDPESSEEQPPAQIPEQEGVLEGHIVDRDSGHILQGAFATVLESGDTTSSDELGHYLLRMPRPKTSGSGKQPWLVTLRISSDGYRTEERRNLEVMAGNSRRVPVRLERLDKDALTSEPAVIDESPRTAPEGLRNYEWVFDASTD